MLSQCIIIITSSAFITACSGFEPLWNHFGVLQVLPGARFGRPGSSMELPGLLLGALGALCDPVRLPEGAFGAPWRLWRRPWAPLRSPKRFQEAALGVSLEAKIELSCRRELSFHVFSYAAPKVHFFTFFGSCELQR